MTAIADFITERWPKSPVADEAWMMRIRVAMAKKDSTKALECLGQIAADSPRRGDAELMTGQALWNAYLETAAASRSRTAHQGRNGQVICHGAEARWKTASLGLQSPSMPAERSPIRWPPDRWRWRKSVSQAGEGAKAVAVARRSKIGAHTLAKANNKAIDRGNFRVEAFKTALRAYVATQQLDKAEKTMNALEKAGGAVNVARTYVSLGRQLEEALKRLRDEGNRDEAAKAAGGFEFFLTAPRRLAPPPNPPFDTLYWAAETFTNLGDSLAPGDGKPPAEAIN